LFLEGGFEGDSAVVFVRVASGALRGEASFVRAPASVSAPPSLSRLDRPGPGVWDAREFETEA
jgi:hypothetical protein